MQVLSTELGDALEMDEEEEKRRVMRTLIFLAGAGGMNGGAIHRELER